MRHGASVVTRCAGQVPLAARTLGGTGGRACVALVQTAATILSGDSVELDIEVAPGASLELSTLGATVAYPAHAEARQSLVCRVGAGGRFAWLPSSLVLAGGCDLASTTEVELGAGAAAVVREVVALGRHGESTGRCRSVLRCDLEGVPLVRDTIAIDPSSARSPLRLGGARTFGSLALLGLRPPEGGHEGQLALEGPGALFRSLGAEGSTVNGAVDVVARSYLDELWRAR